MQKFAKWHRPAKQRRNLIIMGMAAIFNLPAVENITWNKDDVAASRIFKTIKKQVVIL